MYIAINMRWVMEFAATKAAVHALPGEQTQVWRNYGDSPPLRWLPGNTVHPYASSPSWLFNSPPHFAFSTS